MQLKDYIKECHDNAVNKGFWDKPLEIGTLLMLIVSELGEALEADRQNKYSDKFENYTSEIQIDVFEKYFKDSFEDELSDVFIRLFDLCGALNIDIERHIKLKMKYNSMRERLHGKKY